MASAAAASIDKVHTQGATIAALLQQAVVSERIFDGLLFGQYVTRSNVNYQDHSDAGVVQETQAVITGFLPCSSSCSFYDNCGTVNVSSLQQLLSQRAGPDVVVGWFCCRPESSGRPSMRELAVTESLGQALPSLSAGAAAKPHAVLFGLVHPTHKHAGATLAVQLRIFSSSNHEALPFAISNMGGTSSHTAYHEFVPRMPLAPSKQSAGRSHQPDLSSLEKLASSQQVASLEKVYESFVQHLQQLAKQVEQSNKKVEALQEENRRLLQLL